MSPPNIAHAHQYEEGLRPIGSLLRSLVRLLEGPVVPFDVEFPGHNSEPTCLLITSNFYPAVSLHPEVQQVAGVPCSAHRVMRNRHLSLTIRRAPNVLKGDVGVLSVVDPGEQSTRNEVGWENYSVTTCTECAK